MINILTITLFLFIILYYFICTLEADNTGYVLSVVFISAGLVLSVIMTGVLTKSLVSFIKGPGGSIDTHDHLYM